MSAGGASPETLQPQGRWGLDACKAYVCNHEKDTSWVANVVAPDGMGNRIQPGQGTDLRQVNPTPKMER